MADLPRELDVVQKWFQAVITHPDGVLEGAESEAAQEFVRLKRDELERMVRRSRNLTAEERIHIYANAYYARLMECLRESFPVLMRTLGEDVFNEFAFEYLQRFPPRSYTLGRLGDHFAEFLELTRPDKEHATQPAEANWPDFLIDLARLEWTIEQVFDGPGVEKEKLLSGADLLAISPGQWAQTRLIPVICLTLMKFRYPVNGYYTAMRKAAEGETIEPPAAGEQFLALNRRDYVVRRIELTRPQFVLLEAIVAGRTLAAAIGAAAEIVDATDEELAEMLREWFCDWTKAGMFRAVEVK
jgi:hypothetical protein